MNNKLILKRSLADYLTFSGVFLLIILIYVNILRAVVWDSVMWVLILSAFIFLAAFIKIIKYRILDFPPSKVFIFIALMLIMILYVMNYQGERLAIDLFLYYITPLIYFAFYSLFMNMNILKIIYKIFLFVFIFESAVIILEVVDSIVGFDIHSSRIFTWYFISDTGRFENSVAGNANMSFSEMLPLSLGVHGWPNYTAPLYATSLVIIIASIYSKGAILNKNAYSQFLILLIGLACIYLLGIKTHMVTVFISLVILGLFVNKRIFIHLMFFLLGVVIFTLSSDWAMMRFENYIEQLFVGGHRWEDGERVIEAGRLEVIFNFKDYLSILEIDFIELMTGLSDFSRAASFDYLFEQKILVFALILGMPYIFFIVVLILLGMRDAFTLNRRGIPLDVRAFSVGIGCAIMVLFLEMGHFGFTFNYPNYQVLFLLIAVSSLLKKGKFRINT
jgi:hypothetical protein